MNVTIVRPDNTVVVDGKGHWVDCTSLPAYVKVIQWMEDRGHVEFINDGKGRFLKNHPIADFDEYSYLVDEWKKADDAERQKLDANQVARDEHQSELKRLAATK